MTRILGIDPGSRVTGFGVIDSDGQKSTHVAHGCLDVESGKLADRLRLIFEGVGRVVRLYRPDEMAVELVFMYRNPDSALKLGQARGAAVVAGALADLPVFEFTPAEVKLAIVGLGRADKAQVQHMVKVSVAARCDTPVRRRRRARRRPVPWTHPKQPPPLPAHARQALGMIGRWA